MKSAQSGSPVNASIPRLAATARTGGELEQLSVRPSQDGSFTIEVVGSQAPLRDTSRLEPQTGRTGLSYYVLTRSTDTDAIDSVRLTFRVTRTALEASGTAPSNVTFFRYEDGSWTEYPVTRTADTREAYHYSATVPGLSRFAIGVTAPDGETTSTTPAPTDSGRESTREPQSPIDTDSGRSVSTPTTGAAVVPQSGELGGFQLTLLVLVPLLLLVFGTGYYLMGYHPLDRT